MSNGFYIFFFCVQTSSMGHGWGEDGAGRGLKVECSFYSPNRWAEILSEGLLIPFLIKFSTDNKIPFVCCSQLPQF